MCQTNTGDIFKVIGKGVSFVGEKGGGEVIVTGCLLPFKLKIYIYANKHYVWNKNLKYQ